MLSVDALHIHKIEINNPLWNVYVDSIGNGYVFYRSVYLNGFNTVNPYKPVMFLYENGADSAICVAYERDIALDPHFNGKIPAGKYYDLMSPYGYGGYIGNIQNKSSLLEAHRTFCKNLGYVSEVVKFHPLSNFASYYKGQLETHFHNIICNLTLSDDDIWASFKPKVRKNVRHANSCNLKIVIDYTGKYLDGFLEIYYSTMERNEADKSYFFPKEFFENLNSMQGHTAYFYVFYGNKMISAEIVIYDNKCCYSYLGGTDKEFYSMRPNDFLKYEVIKWGKQIGLDFFVLGGGHGSDDGIYQYKTGFAPNGIYDFFIGSDIFSDDKYDELCAIRRKSDVSFEKENRMRPAYRF